MTAGRIFSSSNIYYTGATKSNLGQGFPSSYANDVAFIMTGDSSQSCMTAS
jgi:hypothetical protein